MPISQCIPPTDARPIPGIPGYLVRDGGELYSCWTPNGMKPDCWHLKIPRPHRDNGRLQIRVKVGDKNKLVPVHHLVLWAFVGPCPPGMEACHNDGDHLNNYAYNLRWDTRESNTEDRYKHGKIVRGVGTNTAKLCDEEIPRIFALAREGVYQTEIARRYGVTQANISFILKRRSWTHVVVDPELLDVTFGTQLGERAPGAKMKADDVIATFRLFKDGMTPKAIAETFGVTESNIMAILKRKSWKSVPIPEEFLPSPR